MFSDICSHVLDCHNNNKIVFLGGDFNSRPCDLNDLPNDGSWKYVPNIDTSKNFFPELCKVGGIMPINHLRLNNKEFSGDFTYIKSNKKSQIDYILTDKNGPKYVKDFNVIQRIGT